MGMGVWEGTRAYLNHLANIKPFLSFLFTPYFSSSLGDCGQITALSILCTNCLSDDTNWMWIQTWAHNVC